MPNDLKHFGVLGMKWGRRQASGIVIEKDLINAKDRDIKKGTVIQNISGAELPSSLKNGLYTSYTKFDNDHYSDIMGNFMYSKNAYKNTFLAKKDIKVASDKKAVEIFLKTLKENPDDVVKDMNDAHNRAAFAIPRLESVMKRKVSSLKLNNPEGEEEQKLARDFLVNTLMDKQSNKARNLFFGNVIKEGYDALSDPNDRDAWAQDPLIIVNVNSIKGKGSLKLTTKDLDYYSRYTFSNEHQSQHRNLSEVQR